MTTHTLPTEQLDRTYLDALLPHPSYCPGFELWDALATDGVHYLVASDRIESVGTRLYMRSGGAIDLVSATHIGPNPDVAGWDATRPWAKR